MKTKLGFGGLLKAGLDCEVIYQTLYTRNDVVIRIATEKGNSYFCGKLTDLEEDSNEKHNRRKSTDVHDISRG